MNQLITQETRGTEVEHGCFYFGNWPPESDSDFPFDIEEPPDSLAHFTDTGIAVFSDCGDEDNTARVEVLCYTRPPRKNRSTEHVSGFFTISSDELAVATLMMAPAEPIRAPYTGRVQVRVNRLPLKTEQEEIERDGDVYGVNEDWLIELWPASPGT
ncbi:hypothetical protein [Actinopolyspora mortivallis]|nr:hypothetical protein [Actinopolyspora mortivallis]